MKDSKTNTVLKKNKCILFVGNLNHTFIRNDYELLNHYYTVIPISLSSSVLSHIIISFFLVKWSDIVYCWFASWESFFPILFSKLLRKKSIVIAGGYDCSNDRDFNYGAFTSIKERVPASFIFKNASTILAVSEFIKNNLKKIVKTKNETIVVYNGVNTKLFTPNSSKNENIIVTIGQVTKNTIPLKGLDTFVKASLVLPGYKFVIIGKFEEDAKNELQNINSNVIFTGRIAHKDVVRWLQRAKIYCQLSYIESFGLGLAEAMSCGCIPVGTNKGALPEVIGNIGYLVSYNDLDETVCAIKKAINSNANVEINARKYIKEKFSIKKRMDSLKKIVNGI